MGKVFELPPKNKNENDMKHGREKREMRFCHYYFYFFFEKKKKKTLALVVTVVVVVVVEGGGLQNNAKMQYACNSRGSLLSRVFFFLSRASCALSCAPS